MSHSHPQPRGPSISQSPRMAAMTSPSLRHNGVAMGGPVGQPEPPPLASVRDAQLQLGRNLTDTSTRLQADQQIPWRSRASSQAQIHPQSRALQQHSRNLERHLDRRYPISRSQCLGTVLDNLPSPLHLHPHLEYLQSGKQMAKRRRLHRSPRSFRRNKKRRYKP